ncbi:MAG: PEP-CTERM sorting domain-containing protein [Methanoregulaceae archaeon]|nr:PEP-CTERM sorting domain-containing protein [Methanoregulaceae archaeon]
MDRKRLFLVALSPFVVTVAQAQSVISSTFHLGAYADANQHFGGFQQDFIMQSQGATLNSYSGTVGVIDNDPVNSGKWLRVHSSASASWTDAANGTVSWRNMGWEHNTIDSSGAKLNGFVINGPVWSYTFAATSDATFLMNYDIRGYGDTFGLWGARIEWSGPGGNLDLVNAYDPTTQGTFLRSIVAGNTYTVGLFNMGNYFSSPLPNTTAGYMDADYTWQIGPVPEPSSMLALGGLLVMSLRRRRASGENS